LVNSTENQNPRLESTSSSSEEDNDIDDEHETNMIPDDEKFFVQTDMEFNENIQPNNMMDIFRRQSERNNNSNEEINLEKNDSKIRQEPLLSSTPERQINTQVLSDENSTRKVLTFVEQENGEMNSDDDDDDLALQDNFSFLIAKGMLKPS
jgi:hypothetical protein